MSTARLSSMTSSLPCYAKKATADDVRAFLDHFLLGCVVCECIRYYRFIRTDKNLIVFIVVSHTSLPSNQADGLLANAIRSHQSRARSDTLSSESLSTSRARAALC